MYVLNLSLAWIEAFSPLADKNAFKVNLPSLKSKMWICNIYVDFQQQNLAGDGLYKLVRAWTSLVHHPFLKSARNLVIVWNVVVTAVFDMN